MDLMKLTVGDRVRTVDGAIAEVLSPSEDGKWIRIRYIDSPGSPKLKGTEDLSSSDELAEAVNGKQS